VFVPLAAKTASDFIRETSSTLEELWAPSLTPPICAYPLLKKVSVYSLREVLKGGAPSIEHVANVSLCNRNTWPIVHALRPLKYIELVHEHSINAFACMFSHLSTDIVVETLHLRLDASMASHCFNRIFCSITGVKTLIVDGIEARDVACITGLFPEIEALHVKVHPDQRSAVILEIQKIHTAKLKRIRIQPDCDTEDALNAWSPVIAVNNVGKCPFETSNCPQRKCITRELRGTCLVKSRLHDSADVHRVYSLTGLDCVFE
jgi:hypothetical protein